MKKILFLIPLLLSSLFGRAQDPADFVLPAIISDHAVMQRDAQVKLWGWCAATWDLKIVCSWAPNDTIHTHADKQNYWEAMIQTPKEEGPFSIKFYGFKDELRAEVKDILMGETWLCSGQSNMEFSFRWRVDDIEDRTHFFDNPKIRVFRVDKASSRYPVERIQGKWEFCSKEVMDNFSVVGYCFGKKLSEDLGNVPVGLIGSYWGGTAIEPWMDNFIIEQENLEERTQRLKASWAPTANSCLYNAMIYPIQNYSLSGIIWYQGEANCERYEDYGVMFNAMIRGWRNVFNKQLPFYFVQIAPEDGYEGKSGAYLREHQENVAESLPNVGMVCIGDLVNDVHDYHPTLKRQVGDRLANLALYQTYGHHDLNPFSPKLESFIIKNNTVIINTTAKGVLSVRGEKIENFEIIDENGDLHAASAKILPDGSIRLSCKGVRKPTGARYCFDNASMPNLFDVNGLPLAPFRTDK